MMGFGAGWLGLVVMLGLVVGVMFVVIWAVQAGQRSADSPLGELRGRFARGEIDAQQFDERRRMLGEGMGGAGRHAIGLIGLVLIVGAIVLALLVGSQWPGGWGSWIGDGWMMRWPTPTP